MRYRPLLIIGTLFLVACVPVSTDRMKNGMMRGNQNMMGDNQGGMMQGSFLPAKGKDTNALPAAKSSEVMEIRDGDTITLNPEIVRMTLNGRSFAMYGYNGQLPGPLLKVKQGSTFMVYVTNNIDLPTSVHWHGLRLDNKNDGAVGLTQNEIAPGGRFTYTITVPDEGIYWYHTHVREDLQQPMGLYGGILVTPKKSDAYAPVDSEETVILNDLLLDASGMPVPYGRENADHTLMGRFGNIFLVNGSDPQPVRVGLGSVVRFSILNASSTRTYRIVKPKGSLLKIVGGDNGRYEQEYMTDSYTLSPSERVIAEVYFWHDGVNHGTPQERTVTLVESGPPSTPTSVLSATIVGGVVGNDRLPEFKKIRKSLDVIQDIDAFRPFFKKTPDHTLALDMTMMDSTDSPQVGSAMMGGHGSMMADVPKDGIEWEDNAGMMNNNAMSNMMKWKLVDQATGAANKDLVYTAKVGDKVKIRIINKKDSPHPMQHPIHFHGQRFLVLSDDGVKNTDLVWKDTVLVLAGHTVDILLDASNPGDWMFHCHIAEHLSNGMMGLLKVE